MRPALTRLSSWRRPPKSFPSSVPPQENKPTFVLPSCQAGSSERVRTLSIDPYILCSNHLLTLQKPPLAARTPSHLAKRTHQHHRALLHPVQLMALRDQVCLPSKFSKAEISHFLQVPSSPQPSKVLSLLEYHATQHPATVKAFSEGGTGGFPMSSSSSTRHRL